MFLFSVSCCHVDGWIIYPEFWKTTAHFPQPLPFPEKSSFTASLFELFCNVTYRLSSRYLYSFFWVCNHIVLMHSVLPTVWDTRVGKLILFAQFVFSWVLLCSCLVCMFLPKLLCCLGRCCEVLFFGFFLLPCMWVCAVGKNLFRI